MGLFFDKLAKVKQAAIDNRQGQVTEWTSKEQRFNSAISAKKQTQTVVDQYVEWANTRYAWPDILAGIRSALTTTEQVIRDSQNVRASVWVEKMAPEGQETQDPAAEEESTPKPRMDIAMMLRYGMIKGIDAETARKLQAGNAEGSGEASAEDGSAPAAPKPAANTNTIHTLTLTCRAVNYTQVPAFDAQVINALQQELQNNPLFVGGTNGSRATGSKEADDATGTFRFDIKLKLAKPVNL
jgi:hypothetical protein